MELSILARFGLKKNEIRIYESLLHLGRSKTGAIMEHANISSSSTYMCLASLVKQSLVSYQVRNNVKYYQAELPDQLIEDTQAQAHALERLSKEISSLPITHAERNEINVYQGFQGFKRAYEALAGEVKRDECVKVITYSTHYGKSKLVRKFFAQFDQNLLLNVACRIQMLVDKDLKEIIMSDRSSFVKKYEFRCLPKEYFNPCCVNISDSMVVIGVWSKNPTAFSIRNPAVVESFRTNFDFLWAKGKK